MWMTEEIKMDKKKKTPEQIAALVCVGLLVLLYVVTLVVACLNFPGADPVSYTHLVMVMISTSYFSASSFTVPVTTSSGFFKSWA